MKRRVLTGWNSGSAEQIPPTWNPGEGDEGEVLKGIIVDIKRGVPTRVGKPNDLIVVKRPDGSLVTVWKQTVLEKYFDGKEGTRQFKVGDAIAIQYLGRVRGKRGTYKNYRVAIA
ncbi:MAG: hypothetical protein QXR87_04115 [Candidatus Hadarchaeales archaeon]